MDEEKDKVELEDNKEEEVSLPKPQIDPKYLGEEEKPTSLLEEEEVEEGEPIKKKFHFSFYHALLIFIIVVFITIIVLTIIILNL